MISPAYKVECDEEDCPQYLAFEVETELEAAGKACVEGWRFWPMVLKVHGPGLVTRTQDDIGIFCPDCSEGKSRELKDAKDALRSERTSPDHPPLESELRRDTWNFIRESTRNKLRGGDPSRQGADHPSGG